MRGGKIMAQTSVSIRMDADLKRAFDEFCNANASLPCRGGGGWHTQCAGGGATHAGMSLP